MKKNIIKLNQDEIVMAIDFYLKANGARGDVGTLEFAFNGDGEVLATLDGDCPEEEEALEDHRTPTDLCHEKVYLAKAQRDTVDVLSTENIPAGTRCVWIADVGITVVPPSEWPRRPFDVDIEFCGDQIEKITAWVGKPAKKAVSAAKLADQVYERFGDQAMAVAYAQKDSVDFVSGEPILANVQTLWFKDHGVTVVPLEEWPQEIIEKFEGTEANTASDILGGGGDGPVDRGAALATGRRQV